MSDMRFLLASIVLVGQIALTSPALATQSNTVQLRKGNPPPPPKNPGDTSPGGRRDPANCPQDPETTSPVLTALSPDQPGSTVAERPIFFVYVPKTSAKTAEFSLRDRSTGRGVYRSKIVLNNTPGIIKISLPSQSPTLETGKRYSWSVSLICNPNDRTDDRFVTSTIQRIELDPTRRNQIQQASPREQVSLYQQAGAWYDAVTVLYELQQTQPNDSTLRGMWREVLQSVGIDEIIDRKSTEEKSR
jgi:hypothetical protein